MRNCFYRRGFSVSIPALFLLLAVSPPLSAQNLAEVTTNAGDQSLDSLGWAVTTLNASGGGGGGVSFNNGSSPITLSQPLPAFSNNVTFLGQDLNLTGQDNSQSQLLFQQSFNQQDNLILQNNGGLSGGLDAAVTASSWTMN